MFKYFICLLLLLLTTFTLSGCRDLYRPNFNPEPFLSSEFLHYYDTLPDLPESQNGISIYISSKYKDVVKDTLRYSGEIGYYKFILFNNESIATDYYESEMASAITPVFKQYTRSNLRCYVHYTKRPRTDIEGGYRPLGYYSSIAVFKIENIVVSLFVTSGKRNSEDLNKATKNLIDILTIN